MPEHLLFAVLAIAALAWCLTYAAREQHRDRGTEPTWLWRQALPDGWSNWADLHNVSPTADYETVLATVRRAAQPSAIAVQFATVASTPGAPEHTRVVFTSAVRDLAGRHG
ncbi:hypothetical protein [Mycolicibacterium fluoranthenivorans]|jgi:hypothetical protein|uniref:Uncharacterized protein n=1 Tax=Mycolicibacterium fluoranthenivorans TaxID=258505 RepID=A0A1G4V7E5_9MYCO|nr:hypothetical protein [Mycolicibacterium fluoranthenivorans]SCX01848.1 hypothetical protein SAMN02799620_00343 [Mycolicibacterium fluoranthenivorans]